MMHKAVYNIGNGLWPLGGGLWPLDDGTLLRRDVFSLSGRGPYDEGALCALSDGKKALLPYCEVGPWLIGWRSD